jgi:hypothetical protein
MKLNLGQSAFIGVFGFVLMAATTVVCATEPLHGDLQLTVREEGSSFLVHAELPTRLQACQLWDFISDHEAAMLVPGMLESRGKRIDDTHVVVTRREQESVGPFTTTVHSVLNYVEYPPNKMTFEQVEGDLKAYKGTWLITTTPQGAVLSLDATFVPAAFIPNFIFRKLLGPTLKKRLEVGLEKEFDRPNHPPSSCKQS